MLSSFYVNTAECFLIIKIIIQKEFFVSQRQISFPKGNYLFPDLNNGSAWFKRDSNLMEGEYFLFIIRYSLFTMDEEPSNSKLVTFILLYHNS